MSKKGPFPQRINASDTKLMGFIEEPGINGAFTRAQYPGAWPSASRVFKANSEPDDATPSGPAGTILGSFSHPTIEPVIMYFVLWDTDPYRAIGITSNKLARAQ